MIKTIKHENTLSFAALKENEGYEQLQFLCRGCTMRNREELWYGFLSSISGEMNRVRDNSYLTFEEEPGNTHDPNAVMVVCRGEFFGTVGYVGREFTLQVKEILGKCKAYRIDMVNEEDAGEREIPLVLTWKP